MTNPLKALSNWLLMTIFQCSTNKNWHSIHDIHKKMLYPVNSFFLSGRNLPTIQILKVQMFQAKGLLLQPTTGYLIPQPEWRWFEIFSLKLNRENTWLPAFLMCKAFFQLTCFPEMALWNQKQGSFALLGQKNFLFTYNDNSHNIIIHVWVNTLNLQGLVFTAAKFLLILIQNHFLKKWLNAS